MKRFRILNYSDACNHCSDVTEEMTISVISDLRASQWMAKSEVLVYIAYQEPVPPTTALEPTPPERVRMKWC